MWTMCKVMDNEKLVHYVLKKHFNVSRYNNLYEDMYQAGIMGLMKAVKNFDETLGFQFATYAIPKIRGAIQLYCRDCENPIKVNREKKVLAIKVYKLCPDSSLLEDECWLKEIAQQLEVTYTEVKDAVKAYSCSQTILSLDYIITRDADKDICIQEKIASDEDLQNNVETKLLIKDTLSALDPIQANVLKLYYFENKTQKEIGDILNTTQVQVSRTLTKALKNARTILLGDSKVTGKSDYRKDTIFMTYNGETLSLNEWSKKRNMTRNTIYYRYKRGMCTARCLGYA